MISYYCSHILALPGGQLSLKCNVQVLWTLAKGVWIIRSVLEYWITDVHRNYTTNQWQFYHTVSGIRITNLSTVFLKTFSSFSLSFITAWSSVTLWLASFRLESLATSSLLEINKHSINNSNPLNISYWRAVLL